MGTAPAAEPTPRPGEALLTQGLNHCAAACRVEPAGFSRYDLFNPVVRCPGGPLQRMGSAADGGKLLCGLDGLRARKACVVFSIGSNGQYDFEQAFLKVGGTAGAGWAVQARGAERPGSAAARPRQAPGFKAWPGLEHPPGFLPSGRSPAAPGACSAAAGDRLPLLCPRTPGQPCGGRPANDMSPGRRRLMPALQETKCEVHTFDCHYQGGASQHKGRHFFHPVW